MSRRILIVDDSATMRRLLFQLVKSDSRNESVDLAFDPVNASEKMRANWPDAIVLDINMGRMNGLEFLAEIMRDRPTPVIICSSLIASGNETMMKAIDLGAFLVLKKPGGSQSELRVFTEKLLSAIDNAVGADIKSVSKKEPTRVRRPLPQARAAVDKNTAEKLIVVGASTGGTVATETILSALPRFDAAIMVVQHMPEKFTESYAQRIDQRCALTVKEAANNDVVRQGHVYIAPGHSHMVIKKIASGYVLKLDQGDPVNFHRPSIDVFFHSVAALNNTKTMGVMLTGMGKDGSEGMLALHKMGAFNIAQSENTCVVFSMPRSAIALGAVKEVLDLREISRSIVDFVNRA